MRKTYRKQSTKDYWCGRWEKIPIDEPMTNTAAYPLAYALKTVNDPSGRILEVGCGPGRVLRYFHQRGADIVGLDYVASVLHRLKIEEPTAKLILANVLQLPFPDNSFNYLLAFGVYHGLSNKASFEVALQEARRVLDDDGLLCLSVRTNSFHNRLIDLHKKWKTKRQELPARSTEAFHKSSFSRSELEAALKGAGFKVESIELTDNMTIFYQFRLFRSAVHREFDESLGRREGYKLILPVSSFYRLLAKLFPWHASNVVVSIARRA